MNRTNENDYLYLLDYKNFLEELIYLVSAYKNGIIEFDCLHLVEYLTEKHLDIIDYLSD